MSEEHKINIVLTLDDKQFTGSIKTSGDAAKFFEKSVGKSAKHATGSINDLNQKLSQAKAKFDSLSPSSRDYGKTLKEVHSLQRRVSNVTGKMNESFTKSDKVVKHSAGSINDLTAKLKLARTNLNALSPSSAKYARSLQHVQAIQNRLMRTTSKATTGISKLGGASGHTGFAVLNMNRVISDAPFGMIAISNNIDPLMQSMMMLRTEAGGVKGAFKGLAKSMMGPLGLMTAVALVTAIVTKMSMGSSKAKTAIKNQKDETDELIKKLREYKTTLQDLEKLELIGGGATIKRKIRLKEAKIVAAKAALNQVPLSKQSPLLTWRRKEKLLLLEADLKVLKKSYKIVTGLVEDYSEIIATVLPNAIKLGGKELASYLVSLGMTTDKIRVVKNSLQETTGGLATNTQAYQDNLTAVKHLGDALSEIEGKTKTSKKPKAIEIGLEIIPSTLTKGQQKIFNVVKEQLRVAGIRWDSGMQAYALSVALRVEEDTSIKLKPTKTIGKKHKIKLTQKEVQELRFQANLLSTALNEVGNTMVDAFFEGNLQIGLMIENVGKLILKLLIVQGIKLGLNAAIPGLGLFGMFSGGGLSHKPTQFTFANPKVFKNAPHFTGGGVAGGGIPSILHPKEMVLTESDQANLLNIIRGAGGQGFGGGGGTDINIKLGLRASKNKFVSDLNKAQTNYNSARGVGRVSIINS